jgi:predicted nucleic acid-binding protein
MMLHRQVFADTSALFPLFAPNDHLKEVCTEVLKDLIEKYDVQIITTTLVKYECLSKLRKFTIEPCKRLEQLLSTPHFTVETVTTHLETKGLELFWNTPDKDWGIIDCISIRHIREKSIYYVFASDIHFRQAGLFPLIQLDQNHNPEKAYELLQFF